MTSRRFIGPALALVMAPTVLDPTPAVAGTAIATTAKFTRSDHPRRQVLFLRAPAAANGLTISIDYARTFGPADEGRISGDCRVLGRTERIRIRNLQVRAGAAARLLEVAAPVEEADRVSCRLVFKKMPPVPDGGWAEVEIRVSERGEGQP